MGMNHGLEALNICIHSWGTLYNLLVWTDDQRDPSIHTVKEWMSGSIETIASVIRNRTLISRRMDEQRCSSIRNGWTYSRFCSSPVRVHPHPACVLQAGWSSPNLASSESIETFASEIGRSRTRAEVRSAFVWEIILGFWFFRTWVVGWIARSIEGSDNTAAIGDGGGDGGLGGSEEGHHRHRPWHWSAQIPNPLTHRAPQLGLSLPCGMVHITFMCWL